MKFERHSLKEISIELFADKYDLIMEVWEYDEFGEVIYGAKFKNVFVIIADNELNDGRWQGITEKEAIESYARVVSGKTILLNENGKMGSIQVPRLDCEA